MTESLEKLQAKIEEYQQKLATQTTGKTKRPNDSTNYGLQMVSDLAGGLAIGVFIGYSADKAFGTAPLFICLLSILGCAGGYYNFYKCCFKRKGDLE